MTHSCSPLLLKLEAVVEIEVTGYFDKYLQMISFDTTEDAKILVQN